MVDAVRVTEKALGKVYFGCSPKEASSRVFRRSLFVVQDVKRGDLFTAENVRSIRPGHGLHTRHLAEVLGRQAACDIERGTPLTVTRELVNRSTRNEDCQSLPEEGVLSRIVAGRRFSSHFCLGLAVVTYHGVLPRRIRTRRFGVGRATSSARRCWAAAASAEGPLQRDFARGCACLAEGRRELPPRAVLLTCDDGLLNCLTDMLPVLRQEKVRCLFFVTGASAEESRTMLWYEELFLLFLRAPAGHFEISSEGVLIQGDLGSREQRRAIWWNSVKRLSQVDSERAGLFLQATRIQFGSDQRRDFRERKFSIVPAVWIADTPPNFWNWLRRE